MMKTAPQAEEISFDKSFIDYKDISQISQRDKAYANEETSLRPFYKYSPAFSNFKQIIADKKGEQIDRKLLSSVLLDQYRTFNISAKTKVNIDKLLDENTFTVITAHQPSLFTGPSYFIYKICSILNLSQRLNSDLSDNYIVPVFVTGGEDHDFEEISSAKIFGKKITWEQSTGGSVGKLDTTTLNTVLGELKEILGDRPIANEIYETVHTAFTKYKTYGQGMCYLVNELFGKYGLIVLDMSDKRLKEAFIPIIEKEVFERKSVSFVKETVAQLEAAGYSNQAHPRDINLFYLGDGFRERIIFEKDKYIVNNKDISFSAEEMKAEIHNNPERFSPNVVMRPIYQEYILPNLAYVGGGGELAYWMERQSQFAHFGINFPMLIRRNSVLIVDKGSQKKLQKLSVDLGDLLAEEHLMVASFLKQHSDNEFTLESQKESISKIYDDVINSVEKVDKSLVGTVKAERAKHIKSLENLESRLKKAEKSKFDTGINQLKGIKSKLFPENNLQERKENFLTFYTRYGKGYISYLVDHLDPFAKGLMVIKEV